MTTETLHDEPEILRDANIALTENLSLETVLQTLLDYLGKLLPYDSANVMLRNGDSEFVVSALRRYERFQEIEASQFIAFDSRTNAILRRLCSTKESVLVTDTDREPGCQWVNGAGHVRSWI